MASILKSDTAKQGLTGLIDAGVGLIVGAIAGLFKSKVKPKLAALNNATATLMVEEEKQSKTITYLVIGIAVLMAVAIFVFIVKRKRG